MGKSLEKLALEIMKYCNIIGTDEQKEKFLSHLSKSPDEIMELAEVAIQMFPANLRCDIMLADDKDAVIRQYKEKYAIDCDYISYTSMSQRQIVISIEDMTDQVLVHELCHIITSCFSETKLPYIINELIAQYGERHYL